MERGTVSLIKPIPRIQGQKLDFRAFRQVRWFIDDESPGIDASLNRHVEQVASERPPNKALHPTSRAGCPDCVRRHIARLADERWGWRSVRNSSWWFKGEGERRINFSLREGPMDTKRVVIGTLVGGVAMYVFGYLIFELAFGQFYARNAGSATGVARDVYLQWAIVLGSLSLAALVTVAIESRPGPLTIRKGFTTGATVGFLLWLGVDFIRYGMTNVPNLARTLVDPLLEIVRNGAVGAMIAAVVVRIAKTEPRAYVRT